jgi:hypothetical protein
MAFNIADALDDKQMSQDDIRMLLLCYNPNALSFCDYYGINIYQFIDIAFTTTTD